MSSAAWRAANLERAKASEAGRNARYRATHPDRVKAASAAWKAAHPEQVKAQYTAWRAANRERLRAADRARYAADPKRRLAYLDDRPIVYVWVAPDGKADYVGRGTRGRAQHHKHPARRAPWWTPQHMLLTLTCDSEWHAMEMEGRWGGRYLPRHNVEGYRHAVAH